MAKPHPVELRERVVAHVEEGHTHRAAASRFKVSIKFVNDMVRLKHKAGSLEPKPLGNNRGKGKLEPHRDWVAERLAVNGGITLDELRVELHEALGVEIHSTNVGRFLRQIGLSHKKRLSTPANNAARM